jgi:hypothetical protein
MLIQRYRPKLAPVMWLRFWRRPRAEKWLAAESVVVCFLSVVALRVIGFGSWKRLLATSSPGASVRLEASACDEAAIAEGYASVVDMVARNTWGLVTCLPRSLALWWLLRRRGIESELQLGVRKDTGRVVAHAWVVCHGQVIGETEHERYSSFERGTRMTSQ